MCNCVIVVFLEKRGAILFDFSGLFQQGLPKWMVTFNKKLIRVFTPTPGDPINFEDTIEKTLRDWRERFRLRQVLFDPYQMAAVSQRLARERIPIEEYPQTVPNLTAATSNLFDLISARQLVLYPDAQMRQSARRPHAVSAVGKLKDREANPRKPDPQARSACHARFAATVIPGAGANGRTQSAEACVVGGRARVHAACVRAR
jgi:hypothetical protein